LGYNILIINLLKKLTIPDTGVASHTYNTDKHWCTHGGFGVQTPNEYKKFSLEQNLQPSIILRYVKSCLSVFLLLLYSLLNKGSCVLLDPEGASQKSTLVVVVVISFL